MRHLKSPSTLFLASAQIIRYASLYIKRNLLPYLLLSREAVIKTPDPYIKFKIEARIKDEKKHSECKNLPKKVVRVTALVAKEVNNAKEEENEKLIQMKAKHKRVRDIMKASGYSVDEEVCKMQIRVALRRLKD